MSRLIYKGIRIYSTWNNPTGIYFWNMFISKRIECKSLKSAKNQITRILKARLVNNAK